MLTLSCLVAPPCILVLLTVCRRRSLPLLPPPSRSRSLLPLRGSTLSGSEAPSSPLCPPSNRCGSPSRNMTSLVLPLSIGNASKQLVANFLCTTHSDFSNAFVFLIPECGPCATTNLRL